MNRGNYDLNRKEELNPLAPIWAKRIWDLIREQDISQSALASMCDISESTICGWLKGTKNGFPSANIEKLTVVAEKLKVSLAYLLGFYKTREADEIYTIGSEAFGLDDKSMKPLELLAEGKELYEYNANANHYDEGLPLRTETTLKLINFFIANVPFWRDIEPLLYKYARAKAVESLGKKAYDDSRLGTPGIGRQYLFEPYTYDADIIRYRIMKVFERFSDDCCDRLYHAEKSLILKIAESYRNGEYLSGLQDDDTDPV